MREVLSHRFYLSEYKDKFLNFVGAHPRLISVMAAVGVSFTFSLVGKPVIHHILESAYAIPPTPCIACDAKDFAPGTEAQNPGDAQNFAPGIDQKAPGTAEDLAPGILKIKEIGP